MGDRVFMRALTKTHRALMSITGGRPPRLQRIAPRNGQTPDVKTHPTKPTSKLLTL